MTHTDSKELLESFEKELANQGIWYWTGNNGSKARILTAMQKMLKAGMSDVDVKEIIIDLQFAGYVEHEKQVKHKTGLSVKELMLQKLNELGPIPGNPVMPEQKENHEHDCTSIGAS